MRFRYDAPQLRRKRPPWEGSNAASLRTPYRIPFAYDPRVATRTPESWRMALFGPWREWLFMRNWGRWPVFPSLRDTGIQRALQSAHTFAYPVADSERVRWFEASRCDLAPPLVATFRAFEILRVRVQAIATGVLERVVTYLRAVPLTAGVPVGPEFRTVTDTDPCALPLVHPAGAGLDLDVRWWLVADQLAPNASTPPAMLVGALESAIPIGLMLPGLPPTWNDLRYSWGSRYTETRHVLVQGPVLLRLFASVAGPPGRWDVRVGGMLAGYVQATGRKGAALRAALERTW